MHTFFNILYQWWMAFAHAFGRVNSVIILSVLFIVLVGPYALLSRLAGLFRSRERANAGTFWRVKKWDKPTIEILHRQF